MAPKAAPPLDQCRRAMAVLEKQRAKHQAALAQLNAKYRAWAERARAARQRAARQEIRDELEAKKVGKVKVNTKPKRGRPFRWPGLCHACMRRHLGELGGPGHNRLLCSKTANHTDKLLP